MGVTVDRRWAHLPVHRRAGTSTDLPFRQPPQWLRRHRASLLIIDSAAVALAVVLARYWTFGTDSATLRIADLELPYSLATVVAVPAWLVALAVSHGYDLGPFGKIDLQSRRVVRAGAHFLAVTAVLYYAVNVGRVAREFLIAIIPLAIALTLIGRAAADLRLRRARQRGEADRRTVLLGPAHTTQPVIQHLRNQQGTGIGFATPPTDGADGSRSGTRAADHDLLRVDTPEAALDLLRRTDADLILVTATLTPGELRTLTWALEGSGIAVLVAPPSTPMADPHLNVRPVAGLPLLYVENRRTTAAAV